MTPKPKAPVWLREAFRDGVDERALFHGAREWRCNCDLAQHDPLRRPCSGRMERFHFIPRQRVESALGEMLRGAAVTRKDVEEIQLVGAWDCRNGGLACEGHHRRFDHHLTPTLRIEARDVPRHVLDFTRERGLEIEFARRFLGAEVSGRWGLVF